MNTAHITLDVSSKQNHAFFKAEIDIDGNVKQITRQGRDKSTPNQALLAGAIFSIREARNAQASGIVINNNSAYLKGAITGSMGGNANAELRQMLAVAVKAFAKPITFASDCDA